MIKSTEVDQYIEKAPQEIGKVLQELRGLIADIPNVQEGFKWGQPVYAVTKDFVYLKAAKNHVNLGFFNFESISTAKDLLEGSGKRMRHIKITPTDTIDKVTIQQMIEEAKV